MEPFTTVSGLFHSAFCVCLNIHGRNIKRNIQTESVPTVCMNESHGHRHLVFADRSALNSEERRYYSKRIIQAKVGPPIADDRQKTESESQPETERDSPLYGSP